MKILHALVLLGQILCAAPSSTTIVVSVVDVGGENRYAFDGTVYDEYAIAYGHTYIFDISAVSAYPLHISKHQGGYPAMNLARTSTHLTLGNSDIRSTLFYFFCTTHQGMGGVLKATGCDGTSDVSAHSTCCAQNKGCHDPSCMVYDSECKPSCYSIDGQTACDAQNYCAYDQNQESCRNLLKYIPTI